MLESCASSLINVIWPIFCLLVAMLTGARVQIEFTADELAATQILNLVSGLVCLACLDSMPRTRW